MLRAGHKNGYNKLLLTFFFWLNCLIRKDGKPESTVITLNHFYILPSLQEIIFLPDFAKGRTCLDRDIALSPSWRRLHNRMTYNRKVLFSCHITRYAYVCVLEITTTWPGCYAVRCHVDYDSNLHQPVCRPPSIGISNFLPATRAAMAQSLARRARGQTAGLPFPKTAAFSHRHHIQTGAWAHLAYCAGDTGDSSQRERQHDLTLPSSAKVNVAIYPSIQGVVIYLRIRFEVFAAVNIHFVVFWFMTTCSLVRGFQHFGLTHCSKLGPKNWGSKFCRNDNSHLPHYMLSIQTTTI